MGLVATIMRAFEETYQVGCENYCVIMVVYVVIVFFEKK